MHLSPEYRTLLWKETRQLVPLIGLTIGLIVAAVFFIGMRSVRSDDPSSLQGTDEQTAVIAILATSFGVPCIFAIGAATFLVTQEKESGTLQWLTFLPTSIRHLLSAKLLIGLAGVTLTWLVGTGLSQWIKAIEEIHPDPDSLLGGIVNVSHPLIAYLYAILSLLAASAAAWRFRSVQVWLPGIVFALVGLILLLHTLHEFIALSSWNISHRVWFLMLLGPCCLVAGIAAWDCGWADLAGARTDRGPYSGRIIDRLFPSLQTGFSFAALGEGFRTFTSAWRGPYLSRSSPSKANALRWLYLRERRGLLAISPVAGLLALFLVAPLAYGMPMVSGVAGYYAVILLGISAFIQGEKLDHWLYTNNHVCDANSLWRSRIGFGLGFWVMPVCLVIAILGDRARIMDFSVYVFFAFLAYAWGQWASQLPVSGWLVLVASPVLILPLLGHAFLYVQLGVPLFWQWLCSGLLLAATRYRMKDWVEGRHSYRHVCRHIAWVILFYVVSIVPVWTLVLTQPTMSATTRSEIQRYAQTDRDVAVVSTLVDTPWIENRNLGPGLSQVSEFDQPILHPQATFKRLRQWLDSNAGAVAYHDEWISYLQTVATCARLQIDRDPASEAWRATYRECLDLYLELIEKTRRNQRIDEVILTDAAEIWLLKQVLTLPSPTLLTNDQLGEIKSYLSDDLKRRADRREAMIECWIQYRIHHRFPASMEPDTGNQDARNHLERILQGRRFEDQLGRLWELNEAPLDDADGARQRWLELYPNDGSSSNLDWGSVTDVRKLSPLPYLNARGGDSWKTPWEKQARDLDDHPHNQPPNQKEGRS